MKESKFINKATTEYLKSKSNSTLQAQISHIRTSLFEDYDEMLKRTTEIQYNLEDTKKELTNRTNVLGTEILTLQNHLSSMNEVTGNLKYENFLMRRKIRNLVIGFTITLLLGAACLAKLLI